jgi:deoxyribodipyrimidine photolyase
MLSHTFALAQKSDGFYWTWNPSDLSALLNGETEYPTDSVQNQTPITRIG